MGVTGEPESSGLDVFEDEEAGGDADWLHG
jgi:hypothetical protein